MHTYLVERAKLIRILDVVLLVDIATCKRLVRVSNYWEIFRACTTEAFSDHHVEKAYSFLAL